MAVSEHEKLIALGELISHTEVGSFTIRECDCDEDGPTIFTAFGSHFNDPTLYVIGSGLQASAALLKMATELFDGAMCMDCDRVMAMEDDPWEGAHSVQDIAQLVGLPTCVVYYQPISNKFFRSCDKQGRAPLN